jgi:hypothetical protein
MALNQFLESVVWLRKNWKIAWVTFWVTAIFRTRIQPLDQQLARILRFRPWPPLNQ